MLTMLFHKHKLLINGLNWRGRFFYAFRISSKRYYVKSNKKTAKGHFNLEMKQNSKVSGFQQLSWKMSNINVQKFGDKDFYKKAVLDILYRDPLYQAALAKGKFDISNRISSESETKVKHAQKSVQERAKPKAVQEITYKDSKHQFPISKLEIYTPDKVLCETRTEFSRVLVEQLEKPKSSPRSARAQYFQKIVLKSLGTCKNVEDYEAPLNSSTFSSKYPIYDKVEIMKFLSSTQKTNFYSNFRAYTTSSQVDIDTNQISRTKPSNPLKFPLAKSVLHNCFDVVSNELKKKEFKLTPHYKTVKNDSTSNWVCTYNLKWPQVVSFSEVASTKKDASYKAALLALTWLEENGKIDKQGRPFIYNKKEATELQKKNYPSIVFDQHVQEGMKKIINIYKNDLMAQFVTDLDEQTKIGQSSLTEKIEEKWPGRFSQKFLGLQHYIAPEPSALPISKFKNDFIELLKENRVLIVKGEPGCGKSIRIPQYVLEAWANGGNIKEPCRVIVSEPRRIAAIALAERVVYERKENVGETVGYQVRLKSNFNNRTGRIMYCTTGILLRRLQSDPALSDCTHVILDEAHERDVNTDLLMTLLRLGLSLNSNLKLLIMSATIEAKIFQDYFNGAAVLHIPGFTYPVREYYLDKDNLDLNKTYQMSMGSNPSVIPNEIVNNIFMIHECKPEGAILCFLPGWDDITKVKSLIPVQDDMVVLSLHSKLHIADQRKVFNRPPPGIRKVILATNIAETSVTIDDVVYVIDTGIHKEERFDVEKGVSCIDNYWISQASATQRKGRAGRCQPGECYRLYPKPKYTQFSEHSIPEILRTSLTKIVLDCKVYSNNMNTIEFFEQLVCPPEKDAVEKAVEELKDLELLDENENLTPLGRVLSDFQLPPKLSKAMVNSVIFKCITPVVDVATLYSANAALFTETSNEIRVIKNKFSKSSDHLAMIRLFETWLSYAENGRIKEAEVYCQDMGMVHYRLNTLQKIRDIHFDYLQKGLYEVLPLSDDFSDNDELVKAVLLSSVGNILLHRRWDIVKGRLKKTNVFITKHNSKATITSESVNCRRSSFPTDLLFYVNEIRSNLRHTTLIRETSLISPLAILLFTAKKLEIQSIAEDQLCDKIKGTDQVLLTLKGTQVKFLCDRQQALIVQECKDVMHSCVQYYIYQLTKGGHYNPGIDQTWRSLLNVLDKILIAPLE